MNFDFPAIMVSAVFITGFIWLLDALIWAPKRRAVAEKIPRQEPAGNKDNTDSKARLDDAIEGVLREPILVEYARSLFPVILAVLVLRSFLAEPFRIPSGSMMPTLLVGDFILVNKFAYGVRLPVLNTKVINVGEPKRGDVAVFRYPKNPSIDYIKRIVGVPGDTIAYYNKQLFVNGEPATQEGLGPYMGIGAGAGMTGNQIRSEQLPGVKHNILIDPSKGTLEGEFKVPEGKYFAMGDNRDNSNDSRYWGFVPEENLVGKAFMVWLSWDCDLNRAMSWNCQAPVGARVGQSIN
ncbi:MAG: signal peptidase I [Gammaproteobacteria bacterium]|nr:signal peptidase I [Gammaproteobacteria bacterium]